MGMIIMISFIIVIIALYYGPFRFEKMNQINDNFKYLLLNYSSNFKKYINK